ncbi:hypothetical protein [Ideonella sp.]|uniref:hypothetical protein n=1 Tax=Ideonella sp. TaxID=1929293 RepID=UPI0035B00A24
MNLACTRRQWLSATTALLAASCPLVGAAAAPRYRVTDLGDLGGGNVRVKALNNHGVSVGMANRKPVDNRGVGFVSHRGRMRGMRHAGRATPSSATGINDAGLVCGYDGTNGVFTKARAWLSPDGERVYVPAPRDAHTFAFAVNASGQVTGVSGDLPFVGGAGHFEPFTLPAGFGLGVGRDIHDDGTVLGDMVGPHGQCAFLRQGGVVQALSVPGAESHAAAGINDRGVVCGTLKRPGGRVARAFVWQDGLTRELGSLDGRDDSSSVAHGLNAAGTVVGRATRPADGGGGRSRWCAFVATADGGMVDLNTRLDPVAGAGWVLREAVAINDRGQIVGEGLYQGVPRAFLLSPWA